MEVGTVKEGEGGDTFLLSKYADHRQAMNSLSSWFQAAEMAKNKAWNTFTLHK